MEINRYISIAWRWAWLLILGLALGTVSGYGVAKLQTPIYQANARVLVSHASLQVAADPSSSYYYTTDQQLIDTYLELLKSSSIYDSVSQTVNFPVSPRQIQTAQVSDTDIISITVTDTDPKRVADIANAVAAALIKQNDNLQAGRYDTLDESIQTQIQQVQAQMAQTQSDLDNLSTTSVGQQLAQVKAQLDPLQAQATQLQQQIAQMTPAYSFANKAKLAGLQAQLDQLRPLLTLYQQVYSNLMVLGNSGNLSNSTNTTTTRLQSTLSMYQEIYQNLLNTSETIRLQRLQNAESVSQVQTAFPPSGPISPRPLQSAGLAGVVGLMLAAGIIFLIEYVDNTIKVPEDVDRVLGLPLIGYIAEMQSNGKHDEEVYVSRQPRSPVSEAFRSLRTNLEFAAVDQPLRTILVTGAKSGDGKTTIATNLAAIFAQGGKRVLLLDADSPSAACSPLLRLPEPHWAHRFISR